MSYNPTRDKAKHKEYMRQYRQDKVILCIWHRLRSRAKERGHTCGLSLEHLTEICLKTGYHLLKGRFKDDASLDRIKPDIGYEDGNIQVMTVSENSIKGNIERRGGEWKPMDIEDF